MSLPWLIDSTLAPPKNQRFPSTNVSWVLGTRTDATKNTMFRHFFLLEKGRSNDDVGGARGTDFQEMRPGASSKTGHFLKKKLGGYRRTTRLLTAPCVFPTIGTNSIIIAGKYFFLSDYYAHNNIYSGRSTINWYFSFRTKNPTSSAKKLGADTLLVSSFRMYYCTKKKPVNLFQKKRRMDKNTNNYDFPGKSVGMLCGVVVYLWNILLPSASQWLSPHYSRAPSQQ